MTSTKIEKRRISRGPNRFADIVIWQLDEAVSASTHRFKYRLAYIVDGQCVLRYDNEAGKGDHKHIGDLEFPYQFVSTAQLIRDFTRDIEQWEANQ